MNQEKWNQHENMIWRSAAKEERECGRERESEQWTNEATKKNMMDKSDADKEKNIPGMNCIIEK